MTDSALEANKALVHRWFDEVWVQRREAAVDELTAPDVVFHNGALPAPVDRPMYHAIWSAFLGAFPDLRVEVQDVVAEGDMVAVRVHQTATHTGDFRKLPATGAKISMSSLVLARIEGGRIVESWTEDVGWAAKLAAAAASR